MRPRIFGRGWDLLLGWLLLLSFDGPRVFAQIHEIQPRDSEDYNYAAGKRTFLFGKLVLVPVLAAIGLKFLALLPIVLSKIALLSVMNFLSTNLNLLVSTLFGLKNFLGKYGLWVQEDNSTKRYPDLETFAEFAHQPLLQPSFRYQFVTDGPTSRIESVKPPKMVKVFNGFVPTDYKLIPKINDRRRYLKTKDYRTPKETNSKAGFGKYKCYWTNDDADSKVQLDLGNKGTEQEVNSNKRKFDIADTPMANANTYAGQLNAYTVQEINSGLVPPGEGYGADFYDYRSMVSNIEDPIYRQNSDAESSINAAIQQQFAHMQQQSQLPFTGGAVQVKVANENYRSTQQPVLYFLGELETTTMTTTSTTTAAKFKDEVVAK